MKPTCSTICLVCSSMGRLHRKCNRCSVPVELVLGLESAVLVLVPVHLLYIAERKCWCRRWRQLICSSIRLASSKLGMMMGMCIQQEALVELVQVLVVELELVWLVEVPGQEGKEERQVVWEQELELILPAAHLDKQWPLSCTSQCCMSLGKMPARVLCTEPVYRNGHCSTCTMEIPHYCNQRP